MNTPRTPEQQNLSPFSIEAYCFSPAAAELIDRSVKLLTDLDQLPAADRLNLLAQLQAAIAGRMASAWAEVSLRISAPSTQ